MQNKTIVQIFNPWQFSIGLIAACCLISILEEVGRDFFSYQNTWLQKHEYWRLLSGHLTHLGWSHFFLNMSGLIVIWVLYGSVFRTRVWTTIFLLCCMGISLAFYGFDKNLHSYVGLSGALHGLLAAAVLVSLFKSYRSNDKIIPWEDVLIFVGLTSKIIYEQCIGAVPLTEAASGGGVIVNAHLYGAIIGLVFGAVFVVSYQKKRQFD